MSIRINIDSLPWDMRQKINDELKIEIKGPGMSRWIFPFHIHVDDIHLPFSYAVNTLKLKRPSRDNFPSMNTKFEGVLREEQIILKKEALDLLTKNGTVIISAFVGFGKTACAISLACSIRLKTLILVNKIVLIKQWEESILKFCPHAKIQKLTSKSKFDDTCDFYIINTINVCKTSPNFFKKVGLVIGDEIHLLMAEGLSKAFQVIFPRYTIALSATPYRIDDFNGLINLFFGKEQIIRKLDRKHIVYKVNTGLKIGMEVAESGRVDYNKIIEAQSTCEERNDLILRIVQHFSERHFMILCKRVEQATFIFKKLQELGESVDNLIGKKQEFDKDARILVGITGKISTGFDHPKLDTLLLATSIKEFFIQSLGRVFRSRDTIPFIFDLVDTNPILINHYKTRLEVYKDCGGVIKDFGREFPDILKGD
jgi:superfamily II DNA or RNA helicase